MGAIIATTLLITAPMLEVHGNLVLFDQVYRAVAQLPEDAEANAANAELVETRVRDFLFRAGYELARVEAEAREGHIHLVVDEGRLARLIFRGRGTVTTLRLRLAVVLPELVFNRPEFERQLAQVSEELGIEGATWTLVPVEGLEHTGLQLDELTLVPGRPLRFGGTHDLFVTMPEADWYSGLRLTAHFESYVIGLGVRIRDRDLVFTDDRWDVAVRFGTRFFRGVGIDANHRVVFNDAVVEARYYTPALFESVRPFATFEAEILRRKREDLNTEQYWWDRISASLNLAYEITEGAEVAVGGGLEHRNLFGADQSSLPATGLRVTDLTELEPFATLEGDLILNPSSLRRDRLHQVNAVARQYLAESFGSLDARYQKVFAFGWNDLWVQAAASFRWGGFTVADEVPMSSRYLRGVFGEQIYTSRISSIGLDFRLSLSRDILKVSVFHDLAVFEESERARQNPQVRVADAFGFGLHTLLLDFAQLDVYLAAGFVSDGAFDYGVNAALKKAF